MLGFDLSDELTDAMPGELDAGLAIASRTRGLTFIALSAPIVRAAGVISQFADSKDPLVAWSSRELVIVGVGAAVELRGHGEDRFAHVAMQAKRVTCGAVVGELPAFARPRFLGGAAFDARTRPTWAGFGDSWFALPRWTYVHDHARGFLVLALDAREAQQSARWHDELALVRRALSSAYSRRVQPALVDLDRGETERFCTDVKAITDAIGRGECEKVVAARSTTVTLADAIGAADLFDVLDERHPDCVRLFVRPPGGATFIAATPERLVRLDGATISCDALAGSRARNRRDTNVQAAPVGVLGGDEVARSALLASTKDQREHALVVTAIADALRGLGGDVRMPDAPAVRTLRHVMHLHTPITARLREPRHVLEIVAALHPTPAVGGTPTRVALDWIAAHEPPRGWYAAPVGWFDLEGNGELAVAIRSGLVDGSRAVLFAGAGIVAGSDPERELAETDLKLRALLGALGVDA